MAMERQFVITDTHTRTITAIGFHPIRREIAVGFEDGVIKWWDQDTGKLMLTCNEHSGWITDFQYWAEQKLLLSSGNDGLIMAWGSGGNCMDKIRMDHPVYVMCLSLRKQQIICGLYGGLRLYTLDPGKTSGNVIDSKNAYQVRHHYDIVACVIAHESRVFSAGYDGRFCIYDTTLYPGKTGLDLTHVNSKAHDAGINCMILVKDNENNTWVDSMTMIYWSFTVQFAKQLDFTKTDSIITGSFDRTVKIWSQDGQLRSRLETIFLHTITSLCYIPRARVVWIASASHNATLFDPKAGENVTEFLPTFQSDGDDENVHKLLKLRYNSDSSQIVGSTNRRHVIVWKFNGQGCMTALKCQEAIETLSYTSKVPMLLFSGGSGGSVFKWERLQASYFMYSMEQLTRKECKDRLDVVEKERGIGKKNYDFNEKTPPQSKSSLQSQSSSRFGLQSRTSSIYAEYNRTLVAPSFLYQKTNVAILRCVYVESLDLLVLASEDSNIYVWGFDLAAVSALQELTPEEKAESVDQKYNILLDPMRRNRSSDLGGQDGDSFQSDRNQSGMKSKNTLQDMRSTPSSPSSYESEGEKKDSVTNRVAGFVCRDVLIGHSNCVTSIAVVKKDSLFPKTYLISSGWDRRILIWCLETLELVDRFRNTSYNPMEKTDDDEEDNRDRKDELACDGVVLDMEYCEKRNEFAYASSDGMIYIREFSPRGCDMLLRNTLQGHELEITVVRWNDVYDKWITGAEDGTIKVWSEDGMACEKTLSTDGPVCTLCIDKINGSVVAAVEKVIKVYDLDTSNLVQTNIGHTANIRSVLHLVERSQYITGSWDQTIRIWNTYKRSSRHRKKSEKGI